MAALSLSHAQLLQQVHYDPATGIFRRIKTGKELGYQMPAGYVYVSVGGANQYAHRLAVFYMTGAFPVEQVDHRNGVKSDNRWTNLRQCSRSVNQHNRIRPHKNNTTGFLGVSANGHGWRARIVIPGLDKATHLGTFKTPQEAHEAYLSAKRIHHAEGNTL